MTEFSHPRAAPEPFATAPAESENDGTTARETPTVAARVRKPDEDRFEKYRIRFALEII